MTQFPFNFHNRTLSFERMDNFPGTPKMLPLVRWFQKNRTARLIAQLSAVLALLFAFQHCKIHLHTPIYCFSLHLTADDLFNYGVKHDQSGEPALASEDFKACLAAPTFETQFSPKFKTVVREVVDMRRHAQKPDYFTELLCHSTLKYWKAARMPLKVYVPDAKTSVEGFSDLDRKDIDNCFSEWCALMPDRLSYKLVNSANSADIIFWQRAHKADLGASETAIGETGSMLEGAEHWSVAPITKATIKVVRDYPEINDPSDPRMIKRHAVFLHEIGHSLGLSGHSCNANDLMFFENICMKLSERDRQTLRRLYGRSETQLIHDAEIVLREQAKQGDPYAQLSLSWEMQQNGTATQKELAEAFRAAKLAADQGLPQAQRLVGRFYDFGDGVKRDPKRAAACYKLAAMQGLSSAYVSLGNLYAHGIGVSQNLATAEYFFKKAIDQDSVSAAIDYAQLLSYQRWDTVSSDRALELYKMAARYEENEARMRLAACYDHGIGLQKDKRVAARLRQQALTDVLQQRPDDAGSYYSRACDWSEIERRKEAIADFTKALALKPNVRDAYEGRATEYFRLNNHVAACADYEKALKLDPDYLTAYFGRMYTRLAMGDPSGCLQDIDKVLDLTSDPDSHRMYAFLTAYFAYKMQHDEPQARRMLEQARRRIKPDVWPGPVLSYLSGKITENQLISLSTGDERGTEAHTYIGLTKLLAGKTKDAKTDFEWVHRYGISSYYEYPVAVSMLTGLQSRKK